ncbi:MAG: hypothetical protein ACRERC_21875 [Candidatus Binatia bacterium]
MSDTLLLCRRCGILQPIEPAGRRAADIDEEAAAELALFRAAHAAHGIDEAHRLPDTNLADLPVWDPMATSWFQVATATETLYVRSGRSSVDEPRGYVVASTPPTSFDSVDVDAPLLRRALDRHFYPHAVRSAAIERFVDIVLDLCTDLDPQAVDTSFDDTRLPNTGIAPFPPALRATLLERCSPLFNDWELERVRVFVVDHCLEDGALALRVRRSLVTRAA